MQIPYTASNFDFSQYVMLKHNGTLVCGWPDLLWAAITVGRSGWDKVLQHGLYSYFEMTYRGTMLLANLVEETSPSLLDFERNIYRSPAFDDLDPSEKSAVSYFIGLAMAKLFAEEYFGVSWLIHFAKYTGSYTLIGSKRPDLIGFKGNDDWIVIEAKGRTNNIAAGELEHAKQQVLSLAMIDEQNPILRAVVAGSFPKRYLTVTLDDPEHDKETKTSLKLDPDQFVRDYYRPFIDLVEHSDRTGEYLIKDWRFITVQLEELDIEVGVNKEVLFLWREFYEQELPRKRLGFLYGKQKPIPGERDRGRIYVGNDGIIVKLGDSWK
ncbi:MAG: hypothetical protein JXA21_23860 [Anaerolineae bacterium]|nr:hypothetical protein [Anaerolineae bacterium]